MNIVVLAGGFSHERNVSFSSGSQIANALLQAGHNVALVDSYLGLPDANPTDTLFRNLAESTPYSYTISEEEPNLAVLKRSSGNGEALIGPGVIDACRAADVVFIALHGGMGENGQLQALFDVLGIRYTGSDYAGCLLAMDKILSKHLMIQTGIATPEWIEVSAWADPETERSRILDEIGCPCFIKPNTNGSSIGVRMVEKPADLERDLAYVLSLEPTALVEKQIKGREFSIGILDGTMLPVVEIVPQQGFYDYANKYQAASGTEEICPADLPKDIASSMQQTALRVGNLLRLSEYYRVDFMMDDKNRFYCLEANNLPGMTPLSLIPIEAEAVGIGYVELCDRIARMALA